MCHISYTEGYNEIQNLRRDCFTGDDNDIQIWLLKPAADVIASLLTPMINVCIERNCFPKSWKIGEVTPIPKTD